MSELCRCGAPKNSTHSCDLQNLRIRNSQDAIELLQAELAYKQAQIDRLMLEYCPDEMTSEQIAEWGRNQRPVDGVEDLLDRLDWQEAPEKTQWGAGMMVATIHITNDETASVYAHKDAIYAKENNHE